MIPLLRAMQEGSAEGMALHCSQGARPARIPLYEHIYRNTESGVIMNLAVVAHAETLNVSTEQSRAFRETTPSNRSK